MSNGMIISQIGAIDGSSNAPKYQQVKSLLHRAMENGVFAPEEALPTERDLADGLSVSRITIRKAIGSLVDEGLLLRRQGAGTFVSRPSERIEKSTSIITSFSEDMKARGLRPRSEWLDRSIGPVTPDESFQMGLSPGTFVYKFNRIRYADDFPMALEYAIVDAECLTSVNAVETSLYDALAKAGNRPTRALQRLRAVALEQEPAQLMDLAPGSPGLRIERRGFLASGRLIELTTSYYRGDAYDFLAELAD